MAMGLKIWLSEVLPDSRLLLRSPPFADAAERGRLRASFAAGGIDESRVELRAWDGDRARSHGLGFSVIVMLGCPDGSATSPYG